MNKDPNRIVRLVPLGTDGIAGTLLMINRVLTPELTHYGSVSQRLKSPLVMQSPPTRTKITIDYFLTEPY